MELEDVFREHERAVFAYFVRMVGDRHAAEELAQETFFRACGAAIRFRGDSSVKVWLFGIARRALMEASRKGLFDRPTSVEELDVAAPAVDLDFRIDMERAFDTLEKPDRETLMLVDFLGLTPSEASALMSIDAHTFRMRLHRARKRLRAQLEVGIP